MELPFIHWLQQTLDQESGDGRSLSNDAAELSWNNDTGCVVTTDLIADGSHFDLAVTDPRRIGHKALAVNLSDLAAMGARPIAAFVSLLLPKDTASDLARELMLGMIPLSLRASCPIQGGDTNCWDGRLAINVTALGEVPAGQSWPRSGARKDDILMVTGRLGGSLLGKHLDFEPRVDEALFVRAAVDIHAAMDISDGLSLDAWRLTQVSGCGIELDESALPISPAAFELAATSGKSPLEHALHDGEDFELLLAVSAEDAAKLTHLWPFETPLTSIGRVTAERGLWLQNRQGIRMPLVPEGYEHGAS